jgi:FKBP-type peptidyl-prolyl cis-trans isomerase FklB
MKYFIFIPVLLLASCFSSRKQKTEPIQLSNLADSAGYALGVDVASSLQSRKMTGINQPLIRRALEGFLQGDSSLIDENECFMVLNDYSTKMMSADSVVEKDNTQEKKKGKNKIRKKKSKKGEEPILLLNLADSAGYALGINIANSLKMQDMTGLNRPLIYSAIKSVFAKDSLLIKPEDCYAILSSYGSKMARQKAEAIIKAGESFLAENAKRPEVKTTPSGLQYEIIRQGEGEKPGPHDVFVAHYRGSLIDGTEFDASYNRNQPLEYGVSQVIKGWTEGLQLMPVGSKYKFYIPYQLGYGLNGAPPTIPGGSALVFEVELLEVKKK